MKIDPTPLEGAFLITLEPLNDERGWFARAFCTETFAEHGLETTFVQCNHSHNRKKGTLRGMHYQKDPHAETKLIRCSRGKVYDVIVDLRPDSPTHKQWYGTELSADNGRSLYVPKGFAHGFQTLEEHSDILYQMGHSYVPASADGVRFDDPAFGIHWPLPDAAIISDRDLHFERYTC